MGVRVSEQSISLGSKYEIATPAGDFNAQKRIFSFLDDIELRKCTGEPVAKIEGEISPLRQKHRFALQDGRVYQYECEKMWKQVYTCLGNNETYRLYSHRGLNYSIFKEDRQIAAFTKNHVVFGHGNEYQIRMDSDADLVLVLCMILAYNSSNEDDNSEAVTIDLGNIGPQERPFDETWQPR